MSVDRFYKFVNGKRVEMPRIYEPETPSKPLSCHIDGIDEAGDFKVIIHHGGEVHFNGGGIGFHMLDDCYYFRTLKEARAFCEGGWKKYRFTGEHADAMHASIYVEDHSDKWGTVLANYENSNLTAGLEKTYE